MATKVFHIELRVTDVDTDERMKALRQAVQAAGRTLVAKATLICNGTEPEIVLYGEDFAEGKDDINLDEGENENVVS